MSWEDHGRQQHGWFGHGTSGAIHDPVAVQGAAVQVTAVAVAALPATQRSRFEGWLAYGGVERVAAVLPAVIQALGQEYPERIPLYCRLLAEVAPTVRGRDAHPGDSAAWDWTAVYLIDTAIRLDRPGNNCLSGVFVVAPDTAALRDDGQICWGRACLRHMRSCQRHELDPKLR